ncbi:MAG: response regulator [Desulfobacterales bacterium]|nr:response regulator [Desulfobacterales bacterium]
MSVITIFTGDYCQSEPVIEKIATHTGYARINDHDVIQLASHISHESDKKFIQALQSKVSVFNKFTHEKERAVAWLRLALAEKLANDSLLIEGLCTHLIPREISHVLRICLISDTKYRSNYAMELQKISEKDAVNLVHRLDEEKASWVYHLFRMKDPWDVSLYDIVVPTDKMTPDDIFALIEKNLRLEVIKPTQSSQKAAQDFMLSSQIEVALTKEGHTVGVSARDGAVTLTINKHVLMLSRLEEELKSIVEKINGVKSVETRVGKGYHQTDIYRKYDFEAPKVLLVDDEREFVQTLSERLSYREMGPAVAYDGESALSMINDEDPDVMILDLKMPGIDGIEVLRRVKQTKPEIEVIILTGHGTEADRKQCMELGAFAYFHKPVNIDLLSQTLKQAKDKMRANLQHSKK